jgi:hypothetical protein
MGLGTSRSGDGEDEARQTGELGQGGAGSWCCVIGGRCATVIAATLSRAAWCIVSLVTGSGRRRRRAVICPTETKEHVWAWTLASGNEMMHGRMGRETCQQVTDLELNSRDGWALERL